jgi:hypothetical protein
LKIRLTKLRALDRISSLKNMKEPKNMEHTNQTPNDHHYSLRLPLLAKHNLNQTDSSPDTISPALKLEGDHHTLANNLKQTEKSVQFAQCGLMKHSDTPVLPTSTATSTALPNCGGLT